MSYVCNRCGKKFETDEGGHEVERGKFFGTYCEECWKVVGPEWKASKRKQAIEEVGRDNDKMNMFIQKQFGGKL